MRALILFSVALLSCSTERPDPKPAANHWADERLWPVLEAQEHRNSAALCDLLSDSNVVVRAAAALAFASVQDSSAVTCLVNALKDTSSVVRRNCAFALGFIADSLTLNAMAIHAATENDSTVQQALRSASFLALHRSGWLEDVRPFSRILDAGTPHDRARAADALRRQPPTAIRAFGPAYLKRVMEESDPEVQSLLIRGLSVLEGDAHIAPLEQWALRGRTPSIRISALRALGRSIRDGERITLYRSLADPEPMVRAVALEVLTQFGGDIDPDSVLNTLPLIDVRDTIVWYGTLGLLNNAPKYRSVARDRLLGHPPVGPYARAEWLRAIVRDEREFPDDSLVTFMLGEEHPAGRQAAFELLYKRVQYRMMMPRAISHTMQVREAAPFYRLVLESGDAGLISALAEQMRFASSDGLATLFPKDLEQKALASLQPLSDLEAILLLHELAARRDGLPQATRATVAFNHPTDRTRLLVLEQGQRYRITTSKGEIIIATDVDDCPGSSLVFDSLVVAGYYNGKAFHRVVPDFVAQGGCPRGDGYGGMPWTLRTEIGRKPFSTGSVGLASAGRDTESCQFFITHSPTPHLDGRYTRFGEVVSGMDVLWKLQVGDVMKRVERLD